MSTDPTSPLGTAAARREAAAIEMEFADSRDPRVDKDLYTARALAHAQIAIALELADIAESLRMLAGQPRDPEEYV